MRIPDKAIAEAVQVILTTRDFCGNERLAVIEWMADEHRAGRLHGVDGGKLYRIANFRANAEWNTWKKRAGVPAKYTW